MKRPLIPRKVIVSDNSRTLALVAACSAVVVALLLGFVGGFVFEHAMSQREGEMDVIAENIVNTTRDLEMLQASFFEAAMNVSGLAAVETITQNGTFSAASSGGGAPATGTYEVRNVRLGPLNFTHFILALDAGQTIVMPAFGAAITFVITIDTFDPALRIYSAGSGFTMLRQDLSATNEARLFVDDECLAAGTCGYVGHDGSTTLTFTTLTFSFLSPDRVLQVDTALSFTAPLEILIATA